MKVALVTTDGGTKETGETLLIINVKEGDILVQALEEFAARNKRSKAAKRLAFEAQSIAVVLT